MYKRIDITSAEDFFDIRDVTHISRKILEKTASDSNYDQELINFIDTVDKKPGKYYLLLNAMGAGEHYGSNRNGDYFSDKALRQYHKTFETNAQVYKHHKNKPQLGHPTFGKVLFSHYNEKMKRVELIVELDVNAAPDLKEKIDNGEYPAVSMGCFQKGTPVVMEGFVKKPIENIKVGDKVLTHKGRFRKVTELHKRYYTGKSYTITPAGKHNQEIVATEEHPWLVVEPENFSNYNKTTGNFVRNKKLTFEDTVWKTSKQLNGDEFLVVPFPKVKEPIKYSNKLARLLGYYLGEGHTHKNDNGIEFSVNSKDEFVEEIHDIYQGKVNFKPHTRSENGAQYSIYDKELQDNCLEKCGKYAHRKQLSSDIFNWNPEAKLNFIGAYISGDGYGYKNKVYISSCNKKLLEQIQWLGFSLGLSSTLYKNKHAAGKGFSNQQTIEWVLRFNSYCSDVLKNYTKKVENPKNKKNTGNRVFIPYEDFYLTRIKSIKIADYKDYVYNLEVEEDNSYIVDKWAVHNCKVQSDRCSICGNKAKKVENYCDHAKYMMNRVLPDGRKVFVYNDQPKFFDISFVLIPADRTAGMLAKVANAQQPVLSAELGEQYLKQAGIKEADIEKRIPGAEIKEVASDPKRLIYESQPDMPRELVNELSDSQLPLEKILSTLLGMRIMPKREEFQRIVLCNSGKRDLADDLESKKIIFVVHKNTQPIVPRGVSFDNFSEEIARTIRSRDEYINRAPMTKPVIILRVMEKMAAAIDPREGSATEQNATNVNAPYDPKKGKNVQFGYGLNLGYSKENEPEISPVKNPILALSALGGIYAGYKHLMEPFKPSTGFDKLLVKNPWLWPVLIGATSLGTVALQEKLMEKKSSLDPGLLTRAFIAIPSTYLYSGLQEHKARQGQPISEIGNIVRQYPFLSSIAATWGSGKALRLLDTARYKFASNSNTMTDIFFSLNPTDFDQMFQDIVC